MKDFDSILQDLASPDEEIRHKAVIELIKTNDVRAIPALRDMARDDDSVKIRYYAKKGLHFLKNQTLPRAMTGSGKSVSVSQQVAGGGILADLDTAFSNEDDDEKIAIIQRTIKLNAVTALTRLCEFLNREMNPFVKSKLIIAIGILGNDSMVEILKPYLRDPDYRIKANTIEALGYIGTRTVYPLILQALDDPDNRVRANAIRIINKFGKTTVRQLLESMISSGDVAMMGSAIMVISEIGRTDLLPLLESGWSKGDATIRARVEKTLAALSQKDHEARAILDRITSGNAEKGSAHGQDLLSHLSSRVSQLLSSPEPENRLKGVWESVECEDPSIARLLEKTVLDDQDSKVRAAAINALGRIGDPFSIPSLIQCLSNEDSRTRANAVEVLGKYGDPSVGPAILPLLRDTNNRVRGNAIITVARLEAGDYLAHLKTMAENRDPMLRRTAIFVIMDLDGPTGAVELLDKLARATEPEVRAKALETLSILTDSGNSAASAILSSFEGDDTDETILAQDREDGLESPKSGWTGQGEDVEDLVTDIDIERMIFDLSAENENTRKNSARILESIGNEKCLEPLQEALKDSSNSVRYYAGKALNAIKRRVDFNRKVTDLKGDSSKSITPEELSNLLEDPSRDIRISAIQQVKITDFHLLETLLRHLQKEEDDFVKPALASTIGMLGDERVVPLLVPLLRENDPRVRANTIEALEYTCSGDVLNHIIPFLQDNNNRVRANAIKAVQNAGKENALRHLSDMCRSDQIWTRDSAAFALGALKDSRAVEMLINLIIDEKVGSVCSRAARSLVNLIRPEHISLLTNATKAVQDPRKIKLFSAVATTLKGARPDMDSITGLQNPNIEEPDSSTARTPESETATAPEPATVKTPEPATDPVADPVITADSSSPAQAVPQTAPESTTQRLIRKDPFASAEIGSTPSAVTAPTKQPAPLKKAVSATRKTEDEKSSATAKSEIRASLADNQANALPTQITPPTSAPTSAPPSSPLSQKKTVSPEPVTDSDSGTKAAKVEKIVAKLATELNNADDELRKKAVLELTRIGGPEVLPYLEKAAGDGDTVVRFFAKKGITSIQRAIRNKSEKQNKSELDKQESIKHKSQSRSISLSPGLKKLMTGAAVLLVLAGAVMMIPPDLLKKFGNQDQIPHNDTESPASSTVTHSGKQNNSHPGFNSDSAGAALNKVDLSGWYAIITEKNSDSLKWGNLHGRKMNYSKAADSFEKLMETSPDSIEAHLKYLYSMKRSDQGRKAMSAYHRLVSERSGNPLPLYMEALSAPSHSMAMRKLHEILSITGSFAFARLSIGTILEDIGKTDEALTFYRDYMKQAGTEPKVLCGIARCLYSLGRIPEALETLKALEASGSSGIEPVILKARILLKQNNGTEAVALLEKEAARTMLEPRIQFNLGYALFTSGKFRESAQAFERVTKVAPRNKDAYYFLSLVYDRLGDEHSSIRAAVKASKVDPDFKALYTYQEHGKFAHEAIPDFVEQEDENFDQELTGPLMPMDFFRLGLKEAN